MRAAVVEAFHSPLVVRDLPTPVPGSGQVVVRVYPSFVPPGVLGHEAVGWADAAPLFCAGYTGMSGSRETVCIDGAVRFRAVLMVGA